MNYTAASETQRITSFLGKNKIDSYLFGELVCNVRGENESFNICNVFSKIVRDMYRKYPRIRRIFFLKKLT